MYFLFVNKLIYNNINMLTILHLKYEQKTVKNYEPVFLTYQYNIIIFHIHGTHQDTRIKYLYNTNTYITYFKTHFTRRITITIY